MGRAHNLPTSGDATTTTELGTALAHRIIKRFVNDQFVENAFGPHVRKLDKVELTNRIEVLRDELESRGISTIGFGADPSAAQESCRPSAALQSLEDVQADTPLPNVDGITDNTQQPNSQMPEEIE